MGSYAGFGALAGNMSYKAGNLQGQIAAQEDRRKQSQIAFENAFQLANQAQQQANWNLSRTDRLQAQAADDLWRKQMFQVEQDRWQTGREDKKADTADERAWREKMFAEKQRYEDRSYGMEKDKFQWQQDTFSEEIALKEAALRNKAYPRPWTPKTPEQAREFADLRRAGAENTPEGAAARDAIESLAPGASPLFMNTRRPERANIFSMDSTAAQLVNKMYNANPLTGPIVGISRLGGAFSSGGLSAAGEELGNMYNRFMEWRTPGQIKWDKQSAEIESANIRREAERRRNAFLASVMGIPDQGE